MWARYAWISVCEPSQSLLPLRNCDECDQTTGTRWARFTAASLKHRSGQEAVVRPLVWHKWRHPSHTLVSPWSNGRKRLAWSLARYVQRCNTVCVRVLVCINIISLWGQRIARRCVRRHHFFGDINSGLREFLQIWHKRPLRLKDGLIRMCW